MRSDILRRQLESFRRTHPYTHRYAGGACWSYITCGQGVQTLLLLPGALGLGETAFQYIGAFEHCCRIISPTYPANFATLAQLVDGLAELLSLERIERANVVGGSYSGPVAQQLARRHPERVGKLVLMNTAVPRRSRGRAVALALPILALLPNRCIQRLVRAGTYRFLGELREECAFWRDHFDDVIDRLTKEDSLGRIRVWMDFDLHDIMAPGNPLDRGRAALIVEAEGDSLMSPPERALLKACYPQAHVHTLHGSGHLASLTRVEEYIAAIGQFLR